MEARSVRFVPLYGLRGSGPLSFFLQLGDFNLLLDCGWDDFYDTALLEPLLEVIQQIDAGMMEQVQAICQSVCVCVTAWPTGARDHFDEDRGTS
jgi:hypothetical protein